jgi:organic hydroperoxide reductase OsmC/OhrA
MHAFPHRYTVTSSTDPGGAVALGSEGLAGLSSAPPKEFDGPGNLWSPETLLTAAVNDCFVLGFKAIAAASKFQWASLESSTEGTLDKVEGKMRFTHFVTRATLRVPAGADSERAKKLLEKAEQICLIANSLNAERHLEASVVTG